MIVWLASYPRSGNTALRVLLNRVFGLETLSLYDDRTDIGASEERARLVGHRSHGRTAEAFAAEAAAASDLTALMAELAAGGSRRVGGLPLIGVINGQGVQLIVLGAAQGSGGATSLRLLLAFD